MQQVRIRKRRPRLYAVLSAALTAMFVGPVASAAGSGPFTFEPLATSASCTAGGGDLTEAPIALPEGFGYEVIETETSDPDFKDQADMHSLNETGAQAGRLLYHTHEVASSGSISRTDLWTGETESIEMQSHYERLDGIEWTMRQPKQKGEWFLTEAFQYMIDHGKKIFTAEVGGWYDCGKVDTLLETNLHLLQNGRARTPRTKRGVTVHPPVYVAKGVKLERCTIGPNVAIDEGATVTGSTLRDAIVGRNARVADATVTRSVIGDDAEVRGRTLEEMIAANDEVARAP